MIRGRLVPIVASGIAIALGTTAFHVNGAWDSRTRAVRALAVTRLDLTRERDALGSARARVDQGRIASNRARAERDGAKLSVDDRGAQLVATQADRDQARNARTTLNATVAVVRQCLDGAKTALDALQRNDNAATTAALKSVDDACRRANTAQGGSAPVYAFDFPDPFVFNDRGTLVAFATNASAGNIQVIKQQPDGAWATAGDALGPLPPWASKGRTWAPSVLARPGGFVMYYTALEAFTGRQCISRAVSTSATGPFVDTTTGPMECGESGAIDPEAVIGAFGVPVLLWKHERPAAIIARPLTPDGLAFAGEAHHLLRVNHRWEAGVVEAPSMVVDGSGAWLFYSGNDWNGRRYAIGVAHCDGPLGPCDTGSGVALLSSHDALAGPGGASVFVDATGQRRVAFHAYQEPKVKYPESRLLHIAKLDLASGRPVLVE